MGNVLFFIFFIQILWHFLLFEGLNQTWGLGLIALIDIALNQIIFGRDLEVRLEFEIWGYFSDDCWQKDFMRMI